MARNQRLNRLTHALAKLGERFRTCGRIGTVLQVWLVLGPAVALLGGQPGPVVQLDSVLTNVLQLRQAVWADQRASYSVCLDATVLWASQARNQLFLHDDSGDAQVDIDMRGRPSGLTGQRVHLEGRCMAGQGELREVLVNNDGVHGTWERSGSTYLAAGLHPIRVEWFNARAGSKLTVEYQGPGLPRQKIPGRVLFRPAPTSGKRLPGLDYHCYEGDWERLPDFQHLQPVKSGAAPDFDLKVRTRAAQVGLQFSGLLEVPRAGLYTFWTQSDDGSRLYVGDFSLRLQKLAPAPLPVSHRIAPGQMLQPGQEDQWSEAEGRVTFVCHETGELQLELSSAPGQLWVEVAEPAESLAQLLLNSWIRVAGVCRATYGMDGQRVAGRLLASGWHQFQTVEVAPGLWNETPLVPIGQLGSTNNSESWKPLAHIRGQVSSSEPFIVADETGQLLVETPQPLPQSASGPVEVLGHWRRAGTNTVMRGVYRLASRAETEATNALPVLLTAEQVQRLDRKEAARGYPVKLRGVVIGVGPSGGIALQDSTRAVHILGGYPTKGPRPQVGEFWEVEGTTTAGFAPQVRRKRITYLGLGSLPQPLNPSWDKLCNGSLEMQYVELQGIITAIERDSVVFLTRSGKITIRFPGISLEALVRYQNALVRVRGCISPMYEPQTQQTRVGQIRLLSACFEMAKAAPADPFAAPLKHAGDLLLYDPEAGAMQRLRLTGQVLHQRNGEWYMVDQGAGVRFIPRTDPALEVGDLADVAGFVDLSGPAPVLREAVARRTGHAELPLPQPLSATNLFNSRDDATLVRLVARLESASGNRREQTLTLQAGTREFMARLSTQSGPLPRLAPGSLLQLTGVYAGQGGNRALGREIDSFELLLNSPANIQVLKRPSWWTVPHTLAVVGTMVCAMLGALMWIVLLRRQVEERSLQLTTEVRRHEQSERQRALDADRARIARDLHDELGASLTEIGLLAQAGSGASPTLEKAGQRFRAIRDKAAETVKSLDVIVWLINPRKDTLFSLANYVASYAEEYLSASSIACHLKIPIDLPPLPLTAELRQNLFLTIKEALTNVVRHARAHQVEIQMTLDGEQLKVTVADDGRGFDTSVPVAGNGLVNFGDRLTRLGGHCDIVSRPGHGTTVSLCVPLGEQINSL
jgi:signal transduction histidine kinase